MGVVIKESAKSTVVTYLGVLIGYLNWGYLIPNYFLMEQVGLLKLLRDTSELLAKFSSMGVYPAITRFFPYFKKEEGSGRGILHFALLWGFFGFVVFSVLYVLFRGSLGSVFEKRSSIFVDYLYYAIPFAFLLLYYELIASYLVSLHKIFVPTNIKEVLSRMLTLVVVLIYIHIGISFKEFVGSFIFTYALLLLAIVAYLLYLRGFSFRLSRMVFRRPVLKEVSVFSLVSLLSGVATVMVKYIDSFMISVLIGLDDNGIYGVALLIAGLIEVPKRLISKAAYPLVASAWHNGDHDQIALLYKKTSINQVVIGLLIFLGIWFNLPDLFTFLPEGYYEGRWVVFFIGLSKVIDLAAGNNLEIIITSKHYKFQIIIMVILNLFLVVTNLIFIPVYGIVGASIATAISVFLFNLTAFLFIRMKFGFQPFTVRHLKVFLIGAVTFVLSGLLTFDLAPFPSILVRSVFMTVLYAALVLGWRVSPDINQVVQNLFHRILKR